SESPRSKRERSPTRRIHPAQAPCESADRRIHAMKTQEPEQLVDSIVPRDGRPHAPAVPPAHLVCLPVVSVTPIQARRVERAPRTHAESGERSLEAMYLGHLG